MRTHVLRVVCPLASDLANLAASWASIHHGGDKESLGKSSGLPWDLGRRTISDTGAKVPRDVLEAVAARLSRRIRVVVLKPVFGTLRG